MTKIKQMTAAQAIVAYLIKEEIPYVIGIHGHGDMAMSEALYERRDKITFIPCKNEQYGALTAVAYAKHTGKPLAIITSTGPGSTNLVTAAAAAHANRLPVLLIPGDTFRSGAGPALQQIEGNVDPETRAVDALRPVSRYFTRINHPSQLMKRLPEAFAAMMKPGEEGPAVLALPMDVAAEAYGFNTEALLAKRRIFWPLISSIPPRTIDALLEAKRPLIIAGGGVLRSGAAHELIRFAELITAPVVHTQAGIGALPFNHPLNAFSAGVTGTSCGNELAKKADLIIGIGTRYSDFTTSSDTLFRKNAMFININISSFDVGKQNACCLLGDAGTTLYRLHERYEKQNRPRLAREEYLEEIAQLRKKWLTESDRLRNGNSHPITQAQVIGVLNDFADDSAVIVAAAGSLPGDLQKLWRPKIPKDWRQNRRGYHVEYGYSTMGYEVAGGLGVKLADPARGVYVLVGDGSFLMAHQELVTAVQMGIAYTVILVDNREHRSIRGCQEGNGFTRFGTQLRMFDKESQTFSEDVPPINYIKMAEGCGAAAITATNRNDLQAALKTAQETTNRPTVVVVQTDPEEVVGDYGGWWDVPRPETSTNIKLQLARVRYEKDRKNQLVR